MAINIGTNFSYQGKRFLDNRQEIAENLNDLLEWDILVPEGFEVFVDGNWYVYDSSFNSSITGHFKRRPGYEEFLELDNAVFPITFTSISPAAIYEVGSTIVPTLSWTLQRKGEATIPVEVTVNGSSAGVSSDHLSYISPESISNNKDYVVRCIADSGSEVSATVSIKFYLKKFYGVSNKTSLDASDIAEFSSTWASSWTMGNTTFNCSGGKYPYYVIPSSLYNPNTFKMWIGGLRNTDLVLSTINITNSFGVTTEYTVIRLGTLQNGSPVISFSN